MALCLFLITMATLVTAGAQEMFTAQTPLGPIKGTKESYNGTKDFIYKFQGIRYAQAPMGKLRFQKPVPVKPWTEMYDATTFGPACPQLNPYLSPEDVSEDCLFLNVYVPNKVCKFRKLSVMVWIHGGSFRVDSARNYDGSRIAIEGDVIVVTLNYRLGIFGFLCLMDAAAKGNYGIWDQKLALQWVHDNIESFGGNPKSVTVFGSSAGGVSASFQSLIPSNKGLFQRVILQSGVVSRINMLKKATIDRRLLWLSERTECDVDDMFEFVECLRENPFEDLLMQSSESAALPAEQLMLETLFSPCVDGELFPKHPIKLLDNKNSKAAKFFGSLDLMAGTTPQEGSVLFHMITEQTQKHYNFELREGIPSDFTCNVLIKQIVDLHYSGSQKVKDTLCKYYSANSSLADQSMKAIECMSDYSFTVAQEHMLDTHAGLGKGNTYQYQFSMPSPIPMFSPPSWFSGAGHGDELAYLSIFLVGDGVFSDKEKDVSKRMIQYWASFAKTG